MKNFYKWISETTENKTPFVSTIIKDLNKFLFNFQPSKENKIATDINKSLNELSKYKYTIDELTYSTGFYFNKITLSFQEISKLNKNSEARNYIAPMDRIVNNMMIIKRGVRDNDIIKMFSLIRTILNQISTLYHNELFISYKDEIETAITNLTYDFDLDKSNLGNIKSDIENFEFYPNYHLFYIGVREKIESFLFLNEFDTISKKGAIKILQEFLSLLEGSITPLSTKIRSIIYQIKNLN